MTAKPVPEHISDDLTALERLRLHVHDHEIFPFSPEDAEEILEEYEVALTELQHRREAEAGTPEGWVLVPKAALDWLNGEAPDPAGMEFGEFTDDYPKPAGAFWWRKVFRQICEFYAAQRPLAASPSSPASGVRVKALEWSTDDYEDDVRAEWFAVCVVGQYLAYQRDGDWRLNLDYASGDEMIQVYIGAFETPDAAKAAAQTEYEARVLSALGEHP